MIEKNKEAQTQSLGELQQDLKSLKTLLLSRTPSSSTPAPPLPSFPPRPSIPSWQLSGSSGSPVSAPLDTYGTGVPTPLPFLANGKGKEVVESEEGS
jgi:peroxin-14